MLSHGVHNFNNGCWQARPLSSITILSFWEPANGKFMTVKYVYRAKDQQLHSRHDGNLWDASGGCIRSIEETETRAIN